MAYYNIFRRSRSCTGRGRDLVFIKSVMAKDSVDALERFCGEKSSQTFIAVRAGWNGNSSFKVKNVQELNNAYA